MASACYPQCTENAFTLPRDEMQRVFINSLPMTGFLTTIGHPPQTKHIFKQRAVFRNLLYLKAWRRMGGGGVLMTHLSKHGLSNTVLRTNLSKVAAFVDADP